MTHDPADEFPAAMAGRPLWLMTLADLALLLVGFLVLVAATRHDARGAVAAGRRERFAGLAAADAALPVEAMGFAGFAPGSATLPADPAALVAWAGAAARDPRVTLTVTGSTDGTAIDRDPATGSATLLAADRARAAAAALAGVVPAARLVVATAPKTRQRAALVTLGFTGESR